MLRGKIRFRTLYHRVLESNHYHQPVAHDNIYLRPTRYAQTYCSLRASLNLVPARSQSSPLDGFILQSNSVGTIMSLSLHKPSSSGSTELPELPAEILDIIVDHLHDDTASLHSCATASKKLLYTSRFHLFYRLRIHSARANMGFLEFLEFLQLDPPVAQYICELDLVADRDTRHSQAHRVGPSMLATISQKCPSLQSLALISVARDIPTTSSNQFDPLPLSWSLKSLSIIGLGHWTGMFGIGNILHVLSRFASVKSLKLDIQILHPDSLTVPPSFAGLEVESLTIGGPKYPNTIIFDLCRAICATRTSHSLRSLHVLVHRNKCLEFLGIFLAGCPLLKDITLDLRAIMRRMGSKSLLRVLS